MTSVRPRRSEVRKGEIVLTERADPRGVVHAFSRRADVRPLEMETEHARHPLIDRTPHRIDRAHHRGAVAGDQGREEAGGAVAPVRLADARDRRGLGRIVEQHAAAAVDLQVDEARRQQAAVEIDAPGVPRRRGVIDDALDPAAGDQQGAASGKPVVQQNRAVDQSVQAGSRAPIAEPSS